MGIGHTPFINVKGLNSFFDQFCYVITVMYKLHTVITDVNNKYLY